MVITFTVAANTGLAAVSALFVATMHTVDSCARLRLDSISSSAATVSWLRPIEAALNQVSTPYTDTLQFMLLQYLCAHQVVQGPVQTVGY